MTEQFQTCLHHLNKEKKLSFFVDDEAHCIETWGREFRPTYQQLGIPKSFNVPSLLLLEQLLIKPWMPLKTPFR